MKWTTNLYHKLENRDHVKKTDINNSASTDLQRLFSAHCDKRIYASGCAIYVTGVSALRK